MLALIVITNSYNKARSNCPVPSQATGENTLSPLNQMPLTAGFSLACLKIRSRNEEAINSTRNETDLLAKARRRQQIKKMAAQDALHTVNARVLQRRPYKRPYACGRIFY